MRGAPTRSSITPAKLKFGWTRTAELTVESLPDPQAAARWCAEQRARGRRLGFVPTMGALHDGHLSLVTRAVADNDAVCASIFINPLQFDDADDLKNYPRARDRDHALLDDAGCAMVFGGDLLDFFPDAERVDDIRVGDAGDAARGLEGEHRPGHLQGVRAIVEKLFNTVGECNAYFGEKDFQQTLVVKDLAAQLGGVNIVVCPTLREASGLALSSRNRRLSGEQRAAAATIYPAMVAARDAWRGGARTAGELEAVMRAQLNDRRLRVEYAAVRDPQAWSAASPTGTLSRARALVAVSVGGVRLIDTLALDD